MIKLRLMVFKQVAKNHNCYMAEAVLEPDSMTQLLITIFILGLDNEYMIVYG